MINLGAIAKKLFKKDNKAVLIVTLGLAGILLISLPQLGGGNGKANSSPEQTGGASVTGVSSAGYAQSLEQKLTGLIVDIEGVGQARVMVMLENSGESIYAQEEKRNVDKTTEPGGAPEASKITEKEESEQKYVMVDNGYGQRQALITTYLEPKIQGVVIVCDGADSAHVRQRLINVVTTALHIPSTRVCVEKIKQPQ